MRKTLLALFIILGFSAISQNVSNQEQKFNSKNRKTGRLLCSAGALYVIGGACTGINAMGTDKNAQYVSSGSFIIGSIFLMCAAENIYSTMLIKRESLTIKLGTTNNGVGLCMNFK